MTRQEANKEILKILEDYVNKYPDWRFGQILVNSKILGVSYLSSGTVCADPFYEESEITLNRVKK